MMKVFRKYPGENLELINIDNTLAALQREVDGDIETVRFVTDACIVCNEEGRLQGLPFNPFLGHPFVGTLLIVGVNDEEFCDVNTKIGRFLGCLQ